MELLKAFRGSLRALVILVGVMVLFSLPGLVRCHGEVDDHSQVAMVSTVK